MGPFLGSAGRTGSAGSRWIVARPKAEPSAGPRLTPVPRTGPAFQQGRFAEQTLRGVRLAYELASQVGEKLGRREVLLQGMSSRQGAAWLNCAP